MPKTAAVPATSEVAGLIEQALAQGHSIMLSPVAPPHVISAPSLATTCCLKFGMTLSEARILVALMEHGYDGRSDLHAAMCDGRKASNVKTIDTVVCRLRQKLTGHGVTIGTVWGTGYKLGEDDRDKLRRLINLNSESNMKST